MRSQSWSPAARSGIVLVVLTVSLVGAGASIALGVKGRGNATPSIAANGPFVTVAWGATLESGATDVFTAVSRDAGRTFATPVRVNNVEGDARLNGEQPPHVALVLRAGHEPSIVVVWTTKGANGTKLLQARSEDGGKSFSAGTIVPGTDAAGNRGWEAIAVEPGGRVDAVWLDHREMAKDSSMAASHHDHMGAGKPDGVAMAQQSKLFFGSLDGSAAPRAVTGGVCYCCKTALVGGAGGSIYAAWRHVYPGNLRDMAFTVSRDGGKTFAPPVRVSEDKWMLEGCPDDGPSMAVDNSGRIHIVWPTLVDSGAGAEPTIALFYAMSTDGTHFTPRERVPTEGIPHHPRIALGAGGNVTVAWDESANGARRIAVARASATADGRPRFQRTALTNGGSSIYPAIAVAADTVVMAWTSGASTSATIHIERLAPPLAVTRR
jgi:hypothetical protein